MSDIKEQNIKDFEYKTQCAYGVILQSDGINRMLIFFKDEFNLTPDGKTDTDKIIENYYLK